jgi:hypothetical protein
MPSGLIFASPVPPPPPPVLLFVKTEVIWTGWDGSVWDLTNSATGVCLLKDGVEGLDFPTFTQWTRKSPALAGQSFTGAIAEARRVVLPLLVFVSDEQSSGDWIARDHAFWKSVHPAKEGTLTISPAGAGFKRSIRLRFVPHGTVYPVDPAMGHWAVYSAEFVADSPFWQGATYKAGWSAAPGTATEFYEQTGPQLINLNSGHTTANATVINDGDEDSWPVWTVIGPSTSATVGVDANVVTVPWTVDAGKAVVIDSDPRVRTAIEYSYTAPDIFTDPVDRTADLTSAVDFAAVPPGGTSAVNVSISGGGSIGVALTPLYWRAW